MRFEKLAFFTSETVKEYDELGVKFRFERHPIDEGRLAWIFIATMPDQTEQILITHGSANIRTFKHANSVVKFFEKHFPYKPAVVLPLHSPTELLQGSLNPT